jgi:predicted double-glycine peptidase
VLISLAIYVFVVILLFCTAVYLTRWKKAVISLLVLSTAIACIAWLFWNRPEFLVRVLPVADALFFANWFPFAAAIAAPALVRLGKSRGQRIRIGVLAVCMLVVSLIGTSQLFGKPAVVGASEFYADGNARQTSTDTCSAAATVTLLHHYGIPATEKEIASLALSKEGRGTHPLGIYRALKLKLRETTSTASVHYEPVSADQLIKHNMPAIVNVGLSRPAQNAMEAELVAKYQWEPGVIHSVVFLRSRADRVSISDPDLGTEEWPVEQFRLLYRGVGLYLKS